MIFIYICIAFGAFCYLSLLIVPYVVIADFIALFIYLFLAYLSIFLGAWTGKNKKILIRNKKHTFRLFTICKSCCILELLFSFVIFFMTGLTFEFLTQEAYTSNRILLTGANFTNYIAMFILPFGLIYKVFVLSNWHNSQFIDKMLIIISFSMILFFSLLTATRSALLANFITFLPLMMNRFSVIKKFGGKFSIFLLMLGLLYGFYYYNLQVSTYRSTSDSIAYSEVFKSGIDYSSPYSGLPKVGIFALIYLSNGFYGLSMILEKEQTGLGFGLSGNLFILRNLDLIFDMSYFENINFDMRLINENEYPVGIFWSSGFSPFLSDFGYYGSLIFLFILSRLFINSWNRFCKIGDIISYSLASQIFVVLFMLPMSSPLGAGAGFFSLLILLVLYYYSLKGYSFERSHLIK